VRPAPRELARKRQLATVGPTRAGLRRNTLLTTEHRQAGIDTTRTVPNASAMAAVAAVLVLVVAAIHVYIVVLEMFLWRTPRGLRSFGITQAFADESATLAANQGLYNGFLVAGLVWGLLAADPLGTQVTIFFLACVIVAGLYGAVTVNRRILFVQAVPAALALAAVVIAANA
jgi:putative membrane protein